MKVLIIVPAFNESKNIVNVIESLKKENSDWDILVVDDGSSDNTALLAKSTNKSIVIRLTYNLGIGGAVQTGFIYASRNGYDVAIQFDGDGQHLTEEIHKLLAPLPKGICDVVIGSRFIERHNHYKSTFFRQVGIKIFQILNAILVKQQITDNTSGFRSYNRNAIEFLSYHYPTDYPEPEAVILLKKNGFKIIEVFALMQDRQGGKSSIQGIKSAYYMIKVILAILMTSLRPPIKKTP